MDVMYSRYVCMCVVATLPLRHGVVGRVLVFVGVSVWVAEMPFQDRQKECEQRTIFTNSVVLLWLFKAMCA